MKNENWNEIKNMTSAELKTKLNDLQNKIFKLKFSHSVTPVKNPLEIRKIRRDIARIKTLIALKEKITEKEI
ncbi:MAG: 50S ribosomal protein L29 [Endomicrobium sp.]|nr:50S ribosomal protein L29 [Endomicrobium sp.]